MAVKRIDVISDTHGHLSRGLLESLSGCDLIIHAGDITSDNDFYTLQTVAPLKMCLGNNDWSGEYGPEVTKKVTFEYEGLTFMVVHQQRDLPIAGFNVGIYGHTHVPVKHLAQDGVLLMNPGSPTFPRSTEGPTMGRIMVEDGTVLSAEIIHLGPKDDSEQTGNGWVRSFLNW